jgi:hypothetical protein
LAHAISRRTLQTSAESGEIWLNVRRRCEAIITVLQ